VVRPPPMAAPVLQMVSHALASSEETGAWRAAVERLGTTSLRCTNIAKKTIQGDES